MRIYISGPITGTDDYMNRFIAAEIKIRAGGDIPVNPARINAEMPESTHEDYMKVSLALLSTCDAIYMLQGWSNSAGALEEFDEAVNREMTITFEPDRRLKDGKAEH